MISESFRNDLYFSALVLISLLRTELFLNHFSAMRLWLFIILSKVIDKILTQSPVLVTLSWTVKKQSILYLPSLLYNNW